MRRFHNMAIAALVAVLGLTFSLAPASAQSDLNSTYYAYTSTSSTSAFMLGVTTSSIPGMSAELVSPRYADDFFSGFSMFTGYDFASDLSSSEIAVLSQADEYMVFSGQLDFYDGVAPGYVIFLSSNSVLFIVVGYQSESTEMFDITDKVLSTGQAPSSIPGYTRSILDNVNTGVGSSSSSGRASRNQNPSGFDTVFCNVDPNLAPIDINGDMYLSQEEMATAALIIDEAQVVLDYMILNGIDAIQYIGC